jgi:hypothetical protein
MSQELVFARDDDHGHAERTGLMTTPSRDTSTCGEPSYIALMMALGGFRIRSYPAVLADPNRFCQTLSIVCGDTELPVPAEASIAARLKGLVFSAPPNDPRELGFAAARLAKDGWPEPAIFAVRGVFAFGPCNFPFAEQYALYSLHLNQNCFMAKQLLAMLLAQGEYRKNAPKSSAGELLAMFQKAASKGDGGA